MGEVSPPPGLPWLRESFGVPVVVSGAVYLLGSGPLGVSVPGALIQYLGSVSGFLGAPCPG